MTMDGSLPTGDEVRLTKALAAAYDDHHDWSMRPCQTCAEAVKLLGRPVGCYRYQDQQRQLRQREEVTDER